MIVFFHLMLSSSLISAFPFAHKRSFPLLSFAATKLLSLKSSLHGGRGGGGQCGWRTSVPCRRQGLGCNGTMARAPPILRLPTPPCQAPHLYLLSAFGFGISLAYHTCRFKSLSLPSLTLRSEGGRPPSRMWGGEG